MEKKRNVRAPKSIEVIRLRPGQFIGDNSTCNHLIHECIDNFLDELRNNFGDKAGISFSKEGSILVFDNGRGLPIGTAFDEETKKEVDSIELLFTKLHSGTKFSLDDDSLDSLFGQNGVGLVAVNALSEYVDVKTRNNDEIWHYVFKDGILITKEKIRSIRYSTEIIFKPNKNYFKSVKPDIPIFYERMKLAQAKIQSASFIFNSKDLKKETLEDFARQKLELSKDTPIFKLNYETKIDCSEPGSKKKNKKPAKLELFLTYEAGNTIISGDVNLRFCEGTFLSNIQNLIKSTLPSKIDKKFQKAPERFLLEGLRLYASLQYPTPQFDSQTKTRFVSDVKNDIITPIELNLAKILGSEHIKRTVEEILSQKMNSSISKIAKKKISSDNKLRDCTNRPGDVLYILEGDSAESVFRNCRNTHTEANLPIRGKILNVEKQSLAKISANKEIKNLIEAMGEYPYRYKNVKIVSDGDKDGLHINVLVVLIFQKYFPDMLRENRLSIVIPPLYGAKKGKEFVPIYNVNETEKYKKKNYTIQRFKGLGEMTADQMRHILDKKIEYVVQMPKNKKIVDKMLKIITDVEEKRKYLGMLEYNFDNFITSVFEGLTHDNG